MWRWLGRTVVSALVAIGLMVLVACTSAASSTSAATLAVPTTGSHGGFVSPPPGDVGLPWGAQAVRGEAAQARPVAGTATSLYAALYAAYWTRLLRVDPATGAVLASHTTRITTPLVTVEPVIAGGVLWLPGEVSGASITVPGLNLRTLAPVATIRLPAHGAADGDDVALAAGPGGHRLYVGAADVITVVDPASRQALAHYRSPGWSPNRSIMSLSVSPDGTRLYVSWYAGAAGDGRVDALDPATGAERAQADYDNSSGAVVASSGGIWLQTASGNSAWLMFQPAGDLAGRGERVVPGGGGYPVGTSVSGGVVWFGGDDEIGCADPATGHIRADGTSSGYAKGTNDSALAPVIAVGNDLFASYAGGGNVNPILVRLHPPASCRR